MSWYEPFFQTKTTDLMQTYPYLIQLPESYQEQLAQNWPLVLFLHGSGERGDSLLKLNAQGLPKLIAAGKKFPAIIVSPQCPEKEGWNPTILLNVLDDISTEYRVDPNRIAVTGISMGGYGAWAFGLAYPDRLSALVPICGGGNPSEAAKLRNLPIWVFHGEKDTAVPVKLSLQMVEALRKAGGRPHLTLYTDIGHDSWTPAYSNEVLYPWLFAQRRGQSEVLFPGVPAA